MVLHAKSSWKCHGCSSSWLRDGLCTCQCPSKAAKVGNEPRCWWFAVTARRAVNHAWKKRSSWNKVAFEINPRSISIMPSFLLFVSPPALSWLCKQLLEILTRDLCVRWQRHHHLMFRGVCPVTLVQPRPHLQLVWVASGQMIPQYRCLSRQQQKLHEVDTFWLARNSWIPSSFWRI